MAHDRDGIAKRARFRAWDLFVDGHWVETISRPADMEAEEVKRSLPDEYPRFAVVKPANARHNRLRRGKKA